MLIQRRMIYFPKRLSPKFAEQMAAQEGFQPWRNSDGLVIGWHLPPSSTVTAAVMVVHGNSGCALERGYLAKPIHATGGAAVYVLEYPGYGGRNGSPTEDSLLAAAEEAFVSITNQTPIYIVSESLGTGVAAHLARKHGDEVAGLLLLTPYDSLLSVARGRMPLLPTSLILRDRFDPVRWLKDYRGPVAIVLAEADRVIPTEHGRRLYDGFAGPKRLQVIPSAGHNEVSDQSAEWWQGVFAFWRAH
jgi:pimeloyl-ACP methyl ester carboxylesterase